MAKILHVNAPTPRGTLGSPAGLTEARDQLRQLYFVLGGWIEAEQRKLPLLLAGPGLPWLHRVTQGPLAALLDELAGARSEPCPAALRLGNSTATGALLEIAGRVLIRGWQVGWPTLVSNYLASDEPPEDLCLHLAAVRPRVGVNLEELRFFGVTADWELSRTAAERARQGPAAGLPKEAPMTVQLANQRAHELASKDPGFLDLPQREWARMLNCSVGLVGKLPLWQAMCRQTGRNRQGRPKLAREVQLPTGVLESLAVADSEVKLEKLIREQAADEKASTRRAPRR